MKRTAPVGISNKHLHLAQKDLDVLFGAGYKLTPIKDLVNLVNMLVMKL